MTWFSEGLVHRIIPDVQDRVPGLVMACDRVWMPPTREVHVGLDEQIVTCVVCIARTMYTG